MEVALRPSCCWAQLKVGAKTKSARIEMKAVAPVCYLLLFASASASNLVHHWYSRSCRRFFSNRSYADNRADVNEPLLPTPSDRYKLEQTVTAEDLCRAGRQVVHPVHAANEVVLLPQLRLGYVEVRKCASETVRRALAEVFNATWYRCGDAAVTSSCGVVHDSLGGLRCSTLCLDRRAVQDYYFFTFVRDPLSRFYSAFLQAGIQNRIPSSTHVSARSLRQALSNIRRCQERDHHLESMAMSLSSPTMRPGGMLPIDFIGDMGNLHGQFVRMLRLSGRWSQLTRAQTTQLTQLLTARDDHGLKGQSAQLKQLRTESIDREVQAAYAQDFACFSSGSHQN